ncbi:MAG: hypothetical protein EOO63_00740 [Hymenobacter sp.]|nr:MAG: hypothetical protein EOO63_00740 [Hymenobacter sp.]
MTYKATALRLHKPDPSALERAVLLLGSLYQELELDVAPTGRLLALRNHATIVQTWAAVQDELVARSGGDELTMELLASVEAQLQRPQQLLASLRHDYAFGFLLPNCYQQRFESGFRYEQAVGFPHFFATVDLWCCERLELLAPLAPGRATLRLAGSLDSSRTDLAAVGRAMDVALGLAGYGSKAPTLPGAVRAAYEATLEVDVATGWPVAVEASVRCYVDAVYSKEYFLRLEQLPTL